MTFSTFVQTAETVKGRTPDWRMGQTYFNVLSQVRPDLAELVRGTELDPFYQDDRVVGFLEFVASRWDDAA